MRFDCRGRLGVDRGLSRFRRSAAGSGSTNARVSATGSGSSIAVGGSVSTAVWAAWRERRQFRLDERQRVNDRLWLFDCRGWFGVDRMLGSLRRERRQFRLDERQGVNDRLWLFDCRGWFGVDRRLGSFGRVAAGSGSSTITVSTAGSGSSHCGSTAATTSASRSGSRVVAMGSGSLGAGSGAGDSTACSVRSSDSPRAGGGANTRNPGRSTPARVPPRRCSETRS